jgi:hypothetical protein
MEDGMNHREDLYSLSVRAGKRTYFFDVKSTKGKDLYMTITESKRRYADDGKYFYEKHKLFLYKEDFEKFKEGLDAAVEKINQLRDSGDYNDESPVDRRDYEDDDHDHSNQQQSQGERGQFSNVSFEDLEDE